MNNNTIIQILLGFLLTVVLTMGGWSLKQHFDTNAKLATMETILIDIKENTKWKEEKDKIDTMHWKYHSWSREQITRLFHENQLPPPPTPDLD